MTSFNEFGTISMDALLKQIRAPNRNEIIYKDECVYSFDNPETPTGLYVNLKTFLGFGEDFAERYAERTGNKVFLHIKRKKKLKSVQANGTKSNELQMSSKITRLAIGLEGGYNEDEDKYDYEDTYKIVVFGRNKLVLPYPSHNLPSNVVYVVEAVLSSDSAIEQLKKKETFGTWDGEVRKVSKYSNNLLQLNNGKRIPPNNWKCEKCELTNNLWLNLTDGSILCGRKFFDGSGGNDHAVQHYKEFGYPLAVKLGTIAADDKPDVFSYPEDDMVIDSKLEEHLAHFGINMAAMRKSEKTMVEMELEINQRIGEWKTLTECDSELQPVNGAGYTGMRNLGNSCYLNSVMQVLFTVKDFIVRYVEDHGEKYFDPFPNDPANDFDIQMAKLGNGLWSGKYSNEYGITPSMFKAIVGKNHADFSTKQQQDAYEFYLHVINLLEQHSYNQRNPCDALSFLIEERIECMASNMVKYNYREEHCLPLLIPVEKALNRNDICIEKHEAAKKDESADCYIVPFQACVEHFLATEIIEQFYSSAINDKTTAEKTTRLSTMPDYLMIHLLKFTMDQDWVPKKLNVSINMPDELDISSWRANGLQAHEEVLPEHESKFDLNDFIFNEILIKDLVSMGFTQNASKRAVFHTNNSSLEEASEWIIEHFSDLDINEPFVPPSNIDRKGLTSSTNYVADKESLRKLMNMGFDERLAIKALSATDGNVERATDWIFSHINDPMVTEEAATTSSRKQTKVYRDGQGKYKLVAFISHMGQTAQVGHYVCHILRNGQWIIFNDEKVALSQAPPKSLGYLYLYKREA